MFAVFTGLVAVWSWSESVWKWSSVSHAALGSVSVISGAQQERGKKLLRCLPDRQGICHVAVTNHSSKQTWSPRLPAAFPL